MTILFGFLAWLPWGYNAPKAFGMMVGILMMKGFRPKPLMLPALVCLSVAILSTIGSIDPIMSVFGMWEAPFYGLLGMSMMFLAYQCCDEDITTSCRVAAALMAMFAVAQVIWGQSILGTSMIDGRATATMGSPVYLGAAFVGLFPYLSAPLACLALLATFLTKSKGALLSIAAGYMAYAYVEGRVTRKHLLASVAALSLCLGGYVYRGISDSDICRVEMVKIGWKAFKEHPFLGSGPDTFSLQFRRLRTKQYAKITGRHSGQPSAHNDILQALATTGICGLIAYLWLVVAAWRLAVEQGDAVAAAVIAGVFIQAKFNPIPLPVHVLVAMTLARLS